ncbi:hypothetical protein FA95DRAFT_1578556 [Auriscalpium vulgare]|uniref:Uncharacterized protein n=1 Tax=Auriscalpium vulgare TaxID=40419 RepID=A0ACB8R146_9AGAM|nr:hypothetical protein FA95DRAFT_1578556 [Auriscalpium vulgare]
MIVGEGKREVWEAHLRHADTQLIAAPSQPSSLAETSGSQAYKPTRTYPHNTGTGETCWYMSTRQFTVKCPPQHLPGRQVADLYIHRDTSRDLLQIWLLNYDDDQLMPISPGQQHPRDAGRRFYIRKHVEPSWVIVMESRARRGGAGY